MFAKDMFLAAEAIALRINLVIQRHRVLRPARRQRIARRLWGNPRTRSWLLRHGFTPDRIGQVISEQRLHNLTVAAGLNLLRDFLRGTPAVTGLNYFALGIGTTAAADGDTTLQTEVYRDAFTQTSVAAKSLTIKYYLSSTQANGNTISEAALVGNGATSTPNSGALFARSVFTGDAKTSAQAWTFTWTITLTDDGV